MTSSRRKTAETVLRSIRLYSPEYLGNEGLDQIRAYLEALFPRVDVKSAPRVSHLARGNGLDKIAESMARARIKDPSKAIQSFEPMFGELDFEKRANRGAARVGGIVYDGRRLEEVFSSVLPSESGLALANIVFTQRLISTYSHDEMRHHLRTLVCGFPSIISIPGIVEAPAKPREFYLLKQELEARGAGELEQHKLKAAFKGRFVDYEDSNLTEVLKGVSLQAVVFHLTLNPFCDDPTCRLFNAHWQEDLVKSQTKGDHFCKRHKRLLKNLGDNPVLSW